MQVLLTVVVEHKASMTDDMLTEVFSETVDLRGADRTYPHRAIQTRVVALKDLAEQSSGNPGRVLSVSHSILPI